MVEQPHILASTSKIKEKASKTERIIEPAGSAIDQIETNTPTFKEGMHKLKHKKSQGAQMKLQHS